MLTLRYSLLTLCFCGIITGFGTVLYAQKEYKAIRALIPNDLELASSKLDEWYNDVLTTQNDSLIAKSLYLKGLIYYFEGRYYIAANNYERALTHQSYLQGNLALYEGIWNNLGICYELVGNADKALEAYEKSLQVAIQRQDSSGIGMSWLNLGLLATNQDNYEVAHRYLTRAEAYFRDKPSEQYNLGLVYNNLLVLHDQSDGDPQRAIQYGKQAIAAFEAIGDTSNLLLALGNQVSVRASKKLDLDRAKALLQRIDAIEQVTERIPLVAALVERSRGEYWLAMGDLDRALACLNRALDTYKAIKNNNELGYTYRKMLYILAVKGDIEAYRKLDEAYPRVMLEIKQQEANARYEELAMLYEVKDKESQIQALDTQVSFLDQRLARTLLRSKVKTLLLIATLLLLVLLGLAVATTRQWRNVKHLQRLLFWKDTQLDAHQNSTTKTQLEHGDLSSGQMESLDLDDQADGLAALFRALDTQIRSERWYLNPQLTLQDVCKHLNTNTAYLSKAINTYGGGNFNHYVNQFRVQAAKTQMRTYVQSATPQFTLNTLAFEVGFNSYATFQRAFKAITGFSPSQYLKHLTSAQ